MENRRYPTDLSDDEWDCLGPHLCRSKGRGRPKIHGSRAILNARILRPKEWLPLAATAARIPALEDRFEVMEEAHQPFQEVPDEWNARVDAFWREVEALG
jgi:hypothetical protein